MNLENYYRCARINAPELAKHPEFCQWLHARSLTAGEDEPLGFTPGTAPDRVATWHVPTEGLPIPPGEYSDVFLWVDHGECSNSDLPDDVWDNILTLIGKNFAGIVWLTFLEYP
jgi:hypothetical protein